MVSGPPDGRMAFGGVDLRNAPDCIQPGKFSIAFNVREDENQALQVRPGYVSFFSANSHAWIMDIGSYAAIGTDDMPRFLAGDSANGVYLDNSSLVATLVGGIGGAVYPAQFTGTGLNDGTSGGTYSGSGIASFTVIIDSTGTPDTFKWQKNSGAFTTGVAITGAAQLLSDGVTITFAATTGHTLADQWYIGIFTGFGMSMIPFRPPASSQSWMYVCNGYDYQKLSVPDSFNAVTAQKVGIAEPQSPLDAADQAPSLTTFNVLAASWTPEGTAGATTDNNLWTDTVVAVIPDPIVATRLSVGVSIPYYAPGMLLTFNAAATYPVEEVWTACKTTTIAAIRYYSGSTGKCMVIPTIDLSSSIGRGSQVILNAETVLVLSVVSGSNGSCAFECSTVGTHAAGESITGHLAIVVHGAVTTGWAITTPVVDSTMGTGTGAISRTLTPGLFSQYSPDDYIHATLLLQDIAAVTEVDFIFSIGTGGPLFTTTLTYAVTGAGLDLQILAGEVFQVNFPVSALNGSLTSCNGFKLQVISTASEVVAVGGLWVGGGSNPDIGDDGIPYRYRATPRSSLTGATGNATPDMRYGSSPRRQSVLVKTSALAFADSQVDLIDVYRYGGSITSFRYLGTVEVGSDFTDNYFDDSLTNAQPLPTDNYEPWPTIDVPYSVSTGGGTTITAAGTWVVVSGPATWPSTIASWLPGTLITLSILGTFTLRSRPVQLSPTSYLFEFEESIGNVSVPTLSVLEPNVARQFCPYLVGPDDTGVLFGFGDPFRPGTLHYSKAYNLDSAPDTNTIELCPPSEPLMSGAFLNGLLLVSSTNRWWRIYPSFISSNPYSYNQIDVGRAMVAPRAVCTDGKHIYFWAKDCIARTAGTGYEDLTSGNAGDGKIYPLFPHDGVSGKNVTRGLVTFFAPDYSRANHFRLSIIDGYLYADYVDSKNNPYTIVMCLATGAWRMDGYDNAITVHFTPNQQSGTLVTGTPQFYKRTVMGSNTGKVWEMKAGTGDNGKIIGCVLRTREWDGGDLRQQPQWGDAYIDAIISSTEGLTIQPVSLGVGFNPQTSLVTNTNRQFYPISLGGKVFDKFLGLNLLWYEDWTIQTAPTVIYAWQLSLIPQPEITGDRFGDWSNSMSGGA